MKRRVISCLIVASLSVYKGCYSTETFTKEELQAKVEQVDITVYTKGSLRFEFPKGFYRIQGDTLLAFGVQLRRDTVPYDSLVTAISFSDITSIETETFSLWTFLWIGLGVGGLIVIGITFHDIG